MTPQAAAGAGIGGLAGAGGTAVAYAAGAFNGKESKKKEKVGETYLSQASKLNSKENKEYIGTNDKDRIKTLLGENNSPKYADTLKEAWDSMEDNDSGTTLGKPSTRKDELFQKIAEGNNKDDISNYTSKWCEHIAKKILFSVPTSEGKDKNTWEAFNKACFWNKA
ncbi:hypothetical protein [Candidatus Mycoplasma haematohominis]|uniref:hypothetical protein n=1 Tax=Candidatus Mycoplasma haematohominis TaxID=1494318 RepID=UPI001C0A6ABA|nr:hypothetical protein [Candidatus Mycoplasma haemohominis]